MSKIIFSKYSNERAERFCIRTDILQDADGTRRVEKHPMYPEALEHLEAICRYEASLSGLLQDTGLKVNRCERKDEGLVFSYLEGRTLEELLDTLLAERDIDGVCREIEAYFRLLTREIPTVPFTETEGFREVFGTCEGMEGMDAYAVSDIDMIFSNVMTGCGGTKTLIDYEWTFEFPVPVPYIVYRCLFYYIRGNAKRLLLEEKDLYGAFGISHRDRAAFAKMEEAFQAYILGERIPIRLLYDTVSPGYTDMKPILYEVFQNQEKRKVQVFYDCGEGFCEEESRWYPAGDGQVSLKLPVPEGVRRIRIDPCSTQCVFWMKRLGTKDRELPFETNGISTGAGVYLFETEDPQIVVSEISSSVREIQFEFQTDLLKGLVADAVCSLQNDLENAREQVRQMEGTRAWRLNERMRNILRR